MDFPNKSPALPINRRIVMCGALSLLATEGTALADAPTGFVDSLSGRGFAEAGAAMRALELQSRVFIGDVVGTGPQSRMSLKLGETTQIRLGADAKVRIDRFTAQSGGILELQNGTFLYDGKPQAGREIAVRSPFALIAVRGTKFFAGPSNGVFGVFVEHGKVRVSGGGKTVELLPGLGTNVASPGAAPTNPAKWGAARIQAALASVGG